jgi:hypothetical protein
VVIRVTDDGTPPVTAAQTLMIIVNEANEPPLLAAVGDKTVTAGQLLSFGVSATDADLPPQALVYSLEPSAPDGATIDPATGLFNWLTPQSTVTTTNQLTLRATDSWVPAAFDRKTITVIVLGVEPLVLAVATAENGQVRLTWLTQPGKTYQVEYSENLAANDWTDYGEPMLASGPSLGLDVPANLHHQRFYRVVRLD